MTSTRSPLYPIEIEKVAYDLFVKKFLAGKCGMQRFGQAFYNEFDLHKISKERYSFVDMLYQASYDDAKKIIATNFVIK